MQEHERHALRRRQDEEMKRAPWLVRRRWWWAGLTVIFALAPMLLISQRRAAGLPDSPGGARILPMETAGVEYLLLGTLALLIFAALTIISFVKPKS